MADDERVHELLETFELGPDDARAWRDSGRSPEEFDDWLIDRIARRPSGGRANDIYGSDSVHDFARRAILEALALTPGDRLLEIGCGGGLLLRDAGAAGAAATGLDHSEDMVRLARQRAPEADVVHGSAEHLPFADGVFTAVAMSMVFLFFPEPLAVLGECYRVLASGGRLALYTAAPELRGTPAAPEPLASHSRFYEDETLAELGHRAGFTDAAVTNDDGGQLLTARRP
jgi:SAM-dependent methyltransferase